MTVSAIASKSYQAAKAVKKGVWAWRLEWSKAMKMAWRKIMKRKAAAKAEVKAEVKTEKQIEVKTLNGNKLKLTITAKGIKAATCEHPKMGLIKILSPWLGAGAVNGEFEANGKTSRIRSKISVSDYSAIGETIGELFEARVPGYGKIKKMHRTYEDEDRAFNDSMGIGVSIFRKRTVTITDIDRVHACYPVASAYIKAEAQLMASNYKKSAAGEAAMNALLNGGDYKRIIEKMKDWV